MLAKVASILGFVVLLHAIYSANHYKHLLISLGSHDRVGRPPIDVILELGISIFLVILGQLIKLKLHVAQLSPNIMRSGYEESLSTNDFRMFDNRGKFVAKKLKLFESGK